MFFCFCFRWVFEYSNTYIHRCIQNEWVLLWNNLFLLFCTSFFCSSFFLCFIIFDESVKYERENFSWLVNKFFANLCERFLVNRVRKADDLSGWWPNKSSLIDSHRMLNRWNYIRRENRFTRKRIPFTIVAPSEFRYHCHATILVPRL